jgi:hypothetical protein
MEVSLTTSLLYGCFLIVAYHTWVRFLIRNSGRHNNGIGAFVKALSLVERSWFDSGGDHIFFSLLFFFIILVETRSAVITCGLSPCRTCRYKPRHLFSLVFRLGLKV